MNVMKLAESIERVLEAQCCGMCLDNEKERKEVAQIISAYLKFMSQSPKTVLEGHAVLVLKDDHQVNGTVLVRRRALEQHPELLERLRKEAQELYNQVLVLGDSLVILEPLELAGWLRERFSAAGQPEAPMPWEEAAKWAISGMLDCLEWRSASGSVVVAREGEGPTQPEFVECTSLEQLLAELERAGRDAWREEVPVDGSGQVFDMRDAIDVQGILEERCNLMLKEMGWK